MKIIKNIQVPTGNILITQGERGFLECLSIGDYGKEANIKADFLGLSKEINGVNSNEIMPLTEKWVITISTQYGCSMGCNFCDVPKVGPGINASYNDMLYQVLAALSLHIEIKSTKRLNIHFARMGEPTWNGNVLDIASCLKRNIYEFHSNSSAVHPVVSTMMPKNNKNLYKFLDIWCNDIKNNLYKGNAGLQFSINSTNNEERRIMFGGNAHDIEEVSRIAYRLPRPVGRKYALNFALCNYEIDADYLKELFDSEYFMCKITPMHETNSCKTNNLITYDGYNYYYPYKKIEENLKKAGFDVLVFIPSKDEDESRITCGNAVLLDKH